MESLDTIEFPKLKREEYEEQLKALQLRLMVLQQGLFQMGKRAIVVAEGPDAAGKGGAIRRLVALMDPRGYHVYPIGPPTPDELACHYLQRFWRDIPRAGILAIFDRSWYGRVLVERVEKLTDPRDWKRAYRELNDFERQLHDDGVIIVKLFFHISKDEQRDRFIDRLDRPEKRWKLTLSDLANHELWDDYRAAFVDMLDMTSMDYAPWTVVPANDKKYARIMALRTVSEALEAHINPDDVLVLDPEVGKRAKKMFGNNNSKQ